MLPDIPLGWQTVLAAAGAIVVVIAILRWTGAILTGHGRISELLINRSYNLVDSVIDKMAPEAAEPEPPSSEPGLATSPPSPPPPEEPDMQL